MKISIGNISYSIYKSDAPKISGTSYKEVYKNTQIFFKILKSSTKRQIYIRSKFFNKQKIFFTYFWPHLINKSMKIRVKRLKFFLLGIDLIRNSSQPPIIKNTSKETWYKFAGTTRNQELFFVQIKENKRSQRKQLMSIFPK